MIISDKILYLRKKSGYTQEELAEKLNVSRQSISKWESAQSIPDVTKIMEMASLFSVTTDYLLKDEIEQLEGDLLIDTSDPKTIVTIEIANEFIESTDKSLRFISVAVAMFIIAAIPVITTSLYEEDHLIQAMGVASMFVLVIVGIGLCIYANDLTSDYKFIKDKRFELSYNVEGIIREKKHLFKQTLIKNRIISVSMIMLCVLPLLILSIISNKDDSIIYALSFLLVVVAIAVQALIRNEGKNDCYQLLLLEGEHDPRNEKYETIHSIYWILVTTIYLGWSFITFDWHKTWIVWPVAGILSTLLVFIKPKK